MTPRTTAAVALALLLCLAVAAPSGAHSFVQATRPAADARVQQVPKRVVIWFNEPVEAQFARITVASRRGRTVEVGTPFRVGEQDAALAVRLRSPLRNGRYTVRWRVVSADSHIQSGQFAFRIKVPAAGAPKGAPAPARAAPAPAEERAMAQPPAEISGHAGVIAAARGLTMAGTLLLVGLITTWLLVWRGPRGGLARPREVEAAFLRRWRRLARAALTVTVLGTVAGVVVQGAAASGRPLASGVSAEIVEGVLATGFGKAAVGRIVLLELLVVSAVLWRVLPLGVTRRPAGAVGAAALQPPVTLPRVSATLAVVTGLLLTLSLVSHAAAASPVGWHVAADVVHLGAAGAWIGGLAALLAAVFPATRALEATDRVTTLAPVVVRFSRLAAIAVFLVVVTGTARGLDTVGSLPALGTTTYGRTLLVKLAVFAVLLALGAVNHFHTVRRLRAAAAAGTDSTATQTLQRTVTAEALLAMAIVVITAVLVSLPMAAM